MWCSFNIKIENAKPVVFAKTNSCNDLVYTYFNNHCLEIKTMPKTKPRNRISYL